VYVGKVGRVYGSNVDVFVMPYYDATTFDYTAITNAPWVATNDTRYLASLTNAAAFATAAHVDGTGTNVHGLGTMATETAADYVAQADATYTQTVALAAGALPKSGGIMTGIIQDSFGSASINPSARTLHNTFEDLVIDWDSQTLYNGGVLNPSLSWGLNVLYGAWSTTGQLSPKSYSATITPTPLSYVTNLTISAADGLEQALTNWTGNLTLTWPAGSADTLTRIYLTLPPRGTNTLTMTAGPTYNFITPLNSTNNASTNAISGLWYVSPRGTTNASVTVATEVVP
jgi:hypothetical protein